MSEGEEQQFEAELRRTPPARVPEPFAARLRAVRPRVEPGRRTPARRGIFIPHWRAVWRWLAPAAAVAAIAFLLMPAKTAPRPVLKPQAAAAPLGLKVDDVQVNHDLVASFDVVATLPDGEPVRFRCRQMRDQWVVNDKARGLEIEESRPRVEVRPVGFEIY